MATDYDSGGAALRLFQTNFNLVGAVWENDIERYTLYTDRRNADMAGAALVEHHDDGSILHAIAVDEYYRRQGVASGLIDQIDRERDSGVLEAKVQIGIQANDFYRDSGWTLARTTNDDRMNVWTKEM